MEKNTSVGKRHKKIFCVGFLFFCAAILAGCLATFLVWNKTNRLPAFSQEQYDKGYMDAFRMNLTGRGRMDFQREFWSMQQGFDDAIDDFQKIYKHPRVGPFSYSRLERAREVLSHIELSDVVDSGRKHKLLIQLRQDLTDLESASESGNGGNP